MSHCIVGHGHLWPLSLWDGCFWLSCWVGCSIGLSHLEGCGPCQHLWHLFYYPTNSSDCGSEVDILTSSAVMKVEVHSLVGVACHHGSLVPNVPSCHIWSNGNHVQGSLLCQLGAVVCSWDSPWRVHMATQFMLAMLIFDHLTAVHQCLDACNEILGVLSQPGHNIFEFSKMHMGVDVMCQFLLDLVKEGRSFCLGYFLFLFAASRHPLCMHLEGFGSQGCKDIPEVTY